MINGESNKIHILNYIRIKTTELWAKSMLKEVVSKISKEGKKQVDFMFKELIEVNAVDDDRI